MGAVYGTGTREGEDNKGEKDMERGENTEGGSMEAVKYVNFGKKW